VPASSRLSSKASAPAQSRHITHIRQIIASIYLLHGSLRSHFGGPRGNTGLVLLEALVLGAVVSTPTPLTVPDIGRMLGYSRQAIQRAANKLIELKLLETAANPNHKRASVYRATNKGRGLMSEVQVPTLELATTLTDEFDLARAQRLNADLQALLVAIKAHAASADEESSD
jgi:DNA-binding MarR family transcriptional regulator